MNTELTIENKHKFFAQYYGQEVVFHRNSRPKFITFESLINSVDTIDGYSIYLKPLSSITDEDLNILIELQGWGKDNIRNINVNFDQYPELSVSLESEKRNNYEVLNSTSIDFLRSKGYAILWMGISVEDMLNAGWIKLVK